MEVESYVQVLSILLMVVYCKADAINGEVPVLSRKPQIVLHGVVGNVCPGDEVLISCSVWDTSLLHWRVGSVQITCPGTNDPVPECVSNTNQFSAVVTNISHESTDILLRNITSLLRINNCNESVNVTCGSQVSTNSVQLELTSPPPPPTGLNITVDGSSAEITWNPVEDGYTVLYRVEVYESEQLLHYSQVNDTQIVLCRNVSCPPAIVVNISTRNRCGQWSRVAASASVVFDRPNIIPDPSTTLTNPESGTAATTSSGTGDIVEQVKVAILTCIIIQALLC